MRIVLLAAALAFAASPVSAETWMVREGACSDWQSHWDVEQEQQGVWIGNIEHVHIGGPCAQSTGGSMRSEVRAVIAGDNLFALRTTEDNKVCTYVARLVRENRGRGVALCEGYPQRIGFVVRFWDQQEGRPRRELPPDDALLSDEQRRRPDRRFEFRGFEELFGK